MPVDGNKRNKLDEIYTDAKALAESIQAVAAYQASQLTPPQLSIPRTSASKLADLVARLTEVIIKET